MGPAPARRRRRLLDRRQLRRRNPVPGGAADVDIRRRRPGRRCAGGRPGPGPLLRLAPPTRRIRLPLAPPRLPNWHHTVSATGPRFTGSCLFRSPNRNRLQHMVGRASDPEPDAIASQRAGIVVRAAQLRWGSVLLSLVMVRLTLYPAPLTPTALLWITLACGVLNVPRQFAHRVCETNP